MPTLPHQAKLCKSLRLYGLTKSRLTCRYWGRRVCKHNGRYCRWDDRLSGLRLYIHFQIEAKWARRLNVGCGCAFATPRLYIMEDASWSRVLLRLQAWYLAWINRWTDMDGWHYEMHSDLLR